MHGAAVTDTAELQFLVAADQVSIRQQSRFAFQALFRTAPLRAFHFNRG